MYNTRNLKVLFSAWFFNTFYSNVYFGFKMFTLVSKCSLYSQNVHFAFKMFTLIFEKINNRTTTIENWTNWMAAWRLTPLHHHHMTNSNHVENFPGPKWTRQIRWKARFVYLTRFDQIFKVCKTTLQICTKMWIKN